MNIQQLAEICHKRNRAYCRSIGDMSLPDWVCAPEWQKETMIAGVKYLIDNPTATAEDCHASWMAKKEADGWTFGPIKVPGKKKHPCMRPYAELPADQKKKDQLFIQTVNEFRAQIPNEKNEAVEPSSDEEPKPQVSEGYRPPVDLSDDENAPEPTPEPDIQQDVENLEKPTEG